MAGGIGAGSAFSLGGRPALVAPLTGPRVPTESPPYESRRRPPKATESRRRPPRLNRPPSRKARNFAVGVRKAEHLGQWEVGEVDPAPGLCRTYLAPLRLLHRRHDARRLESLSSPPLGDRLVLCATRTADDEDAALETGTPQSHLTARAFLRGCGPYGRGRLRRQSRQVRSPTGSEVVSPQSNRPHREHGTSGRRAISSPL